MFLPNKSSGVLNSFLLNGFCLVQNLKILSFKIVSLKNSLYLQPYTPALLIQRLKSLARFWGHDCKLTWGGECGCVWQESEASRPPSSRISFSFGWWTVSNSTSFGRSGDTDANFWGGDMPSTETQCLMMRKKIFFGQPQNWTCVLCFSNAEIIMKILSVRRLGLQWLLFNC